MAAKRIVTEPNILGGKPLIEGTRISVAFILQLLSTGMTAGQIAQEYPGLTPEDVLSAVDYMRHST